ncbi:MAG TPA: hypothetical protein PLW05_05760 [Candidatus Marinimicrobia bacterium]|jgi:hypothetical protein|nr:hypothetical protein [Candidatus Neomarinimicrobiota bacterium]HQE96080.1 hypothetical protein [Candidatus Neomarinimicrobiota bacterium]HQH56042.1 hypothetical protein [Candidatus Neomarinimicrobiota bacterium]
MRKSAHFILIIVLTFISVLFFACPDDPEPEPTTCDYPPGNRTFTWRVDTVAYWPSFLGGVHAFADDDAYVMGYIGEGQAPWRIFVGKHWNGTKWDNNIYGTDAEVGHVANDVTGDDHFMVSVGNWSWTPPKPAIGEFDNLAKKWKAYQFETEGELRSVWTDGKGFFIAVGDNGMVYTKDGYKAEWVYSKAPTEFHFTNIVGISKHEMYAISQLPTITGVIYQQYWKCYNNQWIKLYDGQDTTGTPVKLYGTDNSMYDLSVSRCSYNDSLKLYLIGWESFLLESEGQSLNYSITNLSQMGLPLRSMGRTAVRINLYSPNDYWIFGTRYNFYHWNGTDFQKIVMPGLPDDDAHFGDQHRMIKTSTGKIFLPTEVSSQVYVVVQGTP